MPPRPRLRACSSAAASPASSLATVFVRLSMRTPAPAAPLAAGVSILDVLIPPAKRPVRALHMAGASRRATKQPSAVVPPSLPPPRRLFSSTAPWRRTAVVYNPQKDDNGNDMLLEITPRAADRLSQIMAKDKNPHLALRISVESGGCHGFQYLMSLTSLPPSLLSAPPPASEPPRRPPETSPSHPPSSSAAAAQVVSSTTTNAAAAPAAPAIGEDDTVFAFVNEPAAVVVVEGAPKVVLDAPSLELLKGSKVDFTMELIGSQFKIVDNPLATSSCGCGTSFDIKL
ncbi:hypothetical protein GGS23DRAFT_567965 [Durotheca rogersii]|uniref:uncharacterized protein n=1 Tax=Durotheca rogersii TaxID=419775 RepID=UPI0022206669|nr:uncharacterized protein GGS23DRAFT_567965 [Durotheca rogersii]KAI5863047.1 hypothetical protein GGS23DRAFT_567965 [Durotheca rogersii]